MTPGGPGGGWGENHQYSHTATATLNLTCPGPHVGQPQPIKSKDREEDVRRPEAIFGNCSFKGNRAKPDFEPEEEPATQK